MAQTAPAAEPVYDPNQPLAPDFCGNGHAPPALAPPLRGLTLEVSVFEGVLQGYCSDHIDMKLSAQETALLRRVSLALDRQSARHPDGRRVRPESQTDALRWILATLAGDFAGNQTPAVD